MGGEDVGLKRRRRGLGLKVLVRSWCGRIVDGRIICLESGGCRLVDWFCELLF